MYLLSIWVPSDIILCILETSILRIVFTWEGWEHGSMVVLIGGTRLLHFLLHLVAESTVGVETCNSILCCVFWHFAKCVICHAQLHSSAWIFIVPAVGISAVQKQQEKCRMGLSCQAVTLLRTATLVVQKVVLVVLRPSSLKENHRDKVGCWETLPRMLCKLMLLLSGTTPAGNYSSLISLCSSSFLPIHHIVMLFSWHHNYYRICFCLDLSWHVSHWLYVSGMSWQMAVKWSIWSCHIAFICSRVAATSEHAWARWGHVLFHLVLIMTMDT